MFGYEEEKRGFFLIPTEQKNSSPRRVSIGVTNCGVQALNEKKEGGRWENEGTPTGGKGLHYSKHEGRRSRPLKEEGEGISPVLST